MAGQLARNADCGGHFDVVNNVEAHVGENQRFFFFFFYMSFDLKTLKLVRAVPCSHANEDSSSSHVHVRRQVKVMAWHGMAYKLASIASSLFI